MEHAIQKEIYILVVSARQIPHNREKKMLKE